MCYRSSTFAIAAYDAINKEWGSAVQSKFLSVGSLVPWVGENGGVILTLAKTNANYGKKGLSLIDNKMASKEIINLLTKEDALCNMRQLAVIDLQGNISGYTGAGCLDYCGYQIGKNYICIGNTLSNNDVLTNMSETFENTKGDLAEKLLSALIAGQEAGGDKRGMESASIMINGERKDNIGEINSVVDLRIDWSQTPIKDLRHLLDLHRIEYSTNHKNKYFEFSNTIMKTLIDIISKMHGKNYSEIDFNMIINIYKQGLIFNNPLFIDNTISGEFVDKIVSDYYQFEYNQLS